MSIVFGTTARHLIMHLLSSLSRDCKVKIERRLRDREGFYRIARANCVVVSFGKSGRTWLRLMLLRFFRIPHGLAQRHLLSFDNLHHKEFKDFRYIVYQRRFFERLRRALEQKRVFWLSGRRMLGKERMLDKERNNLDSYQVRRAEVGGYRGGVSREQPRAIDALIDGQLLPGFGYPRQGRSGSTTAS